MVTLTYHPPDGCNVLISYQSMKQKNRFLFVRIQAFFFFLGNPRKIILQSLNLLCLIKCFLEKLTNFTTKKIDLKDLIPTHAKDFCGIFKKKIPSFPDFDFFMVVKNIKGFFEFFFLSHLVYSQIWLILSCG